MVRYAIQIRLPLFLIQALLTVLAARYTIVGWNQLGTTMMLSVAMSFSFGWILIATEQYTTIALIDGLCRISGLAAFLLIGIPSANAALACLAVSGLIQSSIQLIVARKIGLLNAVPFPRLERRWPRLHAGHLAAYQSGLVQAIGRNVLPVTVGAVVTASLASTALAAEKVSRAATGVVTAGLGYIMPMLGRSYKVGRLSSLYAAIGGIGITVAVATTLFLVMYARLSQAPLAQLFAGNHLLLAAAAALTASKVMFSTTVYVRLLARGAYRLAARLLAGQALIAAAMALTLRWTESVELFMFGMFAFDLVLIVVAVQSERTSANAAQR